MRFPARRFAIAMTFTGLVLAVGVHPFGDPSPIARAVPRRRSGRGCRWRCARAPAPCRCWRSGSPSARAALVDTDRPRRRLAPDGARGGRRRSSPSATSRCSPSHGLVDPALERDEQPPAAWTDAAAALDELPAGLPRAAAARRRVRGVHLGVHRRSAAPGADRPPARDPRSAPPRFAGGDGPARTPSTTASRSDRPSSPPSPRSPACSAPTRSGCPATPPSTASARRGPELTAELFAAGSDGLGAPVDVRRAAVNAPHVPMVDEQSLSEPAVGTPIAPVELVPVVDPVPIVRASDTRRRARRAAATASSTPPRPG